MDIVLNFILKHIIIIIFLIAIIICVFFYLAFAGQRDEAKRQKKVLNIYTNNLSSYISAEQNRIKDFNEEILRLSEKKKTYSKTIQKLEKERTVFYSKIDWDKLPKDSDEYIEVHCTIRDFGASISYNTSKIFDLESEIDKELKNILVSQTKIDIYKNNLRELQETNLLN